MRFQYPPQGGSGLQENKGLFRTGVGFPGGSEVKVAACNGRVRFLGREDPLEKEMATHASILAWRIPWTEEPGGLQSTGSQRDTTERLHFHFRGRYAEPIRLDVMEEPYWPLISCSPPLM